MIRVKVSSLYLPVQAGPLAILLCFVVLLALFEQPVRGVVMRGGFWSFEGSRYGLRYCAVTVHGVQLLENLAAGL